MHRLVRSMVVKTHMKILMANYEFPPIGGGAGKAHLCLLEEFSGKEDLAIDVLTSAPQPGFSAEDFADNIRIYKVGLHKRNLHYWRKIEVLEWLIKAGRCYRELIGRENYDLVHAFFGFPTGWLCLRSRGKLPYIISLRGSDVPGFNVRLGLDYRLLSGLFRRIWRGASAVIANSAGLARLAKEFMPDLDIDVIGNGVSMERFFPAEDKKVCQPVKVLSVSRLIKRKRLDLLIESVSAAKEMGLEVQLSLVGEGNLKEELLNMAAGLGLTEQVNFMGRVEAAQMPAVYRQNDVFVMASMHEGMSNAMLEAMASGLPIVTTHCEGVDELVGENGIVVEQANAKAIADAVKGIAVDNLRYEKMFAAAVERAGKFTWTKAAEQYLQCYQKVCIKDKDY